VRAATRDVRATRGAGGGPALPHDGSLPPALPCHARLRLRLRQQVLQERVHHEEGELRVIIP
jgi:hypothetical protein